MAENDRRQRELLYSGRVQGIGFRYTARSLASRFDVTGFVRNLPDGRVQMVVEGESAEIDRFLGAVRAEIGYYIRDVRETDRPATGRFQGFEVRH